MPPLCDELAVAVLLLAPDGTLLDLNRSALAHLAQPAEDLVGRPFVEAALWRLDADAQQQLAEAIASAAAGARLRRQLELRLDGRTAAAFDLVVRPLREVDGSIVSLLCEAHDVTDRRRLEQALGERESELARAQQLASVGSWRWAVAPDNVRWSAELVRMFGREPGSPPPSFAEHSGLYAPASWQLLQRAVRQCVAEAVPYTVELEFIRADGSHGWMEAHGEAERDADGRVAVLRGTAQDVSERHALQQSMRRELAQARALADELEARSRRERELLHFLAHEVRQPLHNASVALQRAGAALRAAGERASTEVGTPLRRAAKVIGHVIGALNNTLAAATLLIGGGRRILVDTDLEALVALVLHDVADDDRVRIAVEWRCGARTVSLQPNLSRLALFNLLANALAYSPPTAPVRLLIIDSEDPMAIVFEVHDAGAGIPAELQPHLGERGRRGPNAAHRPGGGLGLYIVRQVVELHRGTLELLPGTGGGTLARMTLPQGMAI